MSGNEINRRSFLKFMGWGGAGAALTACDMPTTVTLEEGKETVVPYVVPEEFAIPGIGVWYASTCQQCGAGCGVTGRIREGRVLKLEGNPEAAIGSGKLCQMGQAGLQTHYNPDRVRTPMLRKGGVLAQATWDEALAAINEKVGGKSTSRVAWFTGSVSGHQSVLLQAYLASLASANHFAHEIVNNAVARAANKDVLGDEQPTYHVAKAKAILSLGADLVGASMSPVHFATQYADFRSTSPRGVLIQVEPSMSLTGSNADLWVPALPGTETALLLGIANLLIAKHGVAADVLGADVRAVINKYGVDEVSNITGVAKDRIESIAKTLKERSPSLILTGVSAEGHSGGYNAAATAAMLNVLLGNVGKTITAGADFPFPQMRAKAGSTRDLLAFAEAADKGSFDVAFVYGTNPAYTSPASLKFEDKFKKIPFKVVMTQFSDETARHADVVLPLASAIEDWGTHVPAYQPAQKTISMQQPLMEKLYPETKGFGDIVLALLKQRQATEYAKFDDYYAYLRSAFAALPAEHKNGMTDKALWEHVLAKGVLNVKSGDGKLAAKSVAVEAAAYQKDTNYPLHLVPAARLGLWDGRHANLSWLQEAPDQITKIVWGTWAELHPRTARQLGVENGDYVRIASSAGTIEVPVYVYRGVHPDVIAVPMGQGHEEYGRYAKGRGANPLKILDGSKEQRTGELAMYATRVKVSKTESAEKMVRLGGSETQVGRKLVATIPASTYNRTEGKGA